MTITLNFTLIFAWVGGIVCALVTLWFLGWLTWVFVGYLELLGVWESLGRGVRNIGRGIKRGLSWLVEKITL